MKSRVDTALELLRSAREAALASFSASRPDYPFVTQVPYVLDAANQPVMLLSGLAEHSRNLAANPHASLLIARTLGDGEIARVTLIGPIETIEPEAGLIEHYLQHHPAAERFLQLGDFAFRRLVTQEAYVVGGFAQAGWLDAGRLRQEASGRW